MNLGGDGQRQEDFIFQFQKEDRTFVPIGKMQQKRMGHTISTVKAIDYVCK